MSNFLERISKLSPQRLALVADELNSRLEVAEQRRRVPLAIVGIGCRLPGGVCDPESFWNLLHDGVDTVGEVPRSRWDVEAFYDENPDTPGRMTTRWGGFVDDPEQFDPKFFGIAPAEAVCMDPQQRLLLETTWESLEHAGIAPSRLAGTKTGVFVGICNADYGHLAMNLPREKITPYFALGLSHAVAAGRISYLLGFHGPSLAVDTSCSASLVAVHLACQSLRLGECDTALTGGVNLILNQDITIALSQSRMMSPDGRCKAFSDSANGFVRSEGAAMIVLKRLPDAVRDGNRILAVVRGSACNQDGRSSGLAAPNGPSQEAVITAALENAGLRPEDVDVIEAHGTGTSLGDPIEAGALNAVFHGRAGKSDPLYVGSVKTNLGHLESAAGIAGLIKLVLSLEHGEIPASLHLGQPSRHIDWEQLPLKVPTELTSWKRRGAKRIGSVSSFGFSGTNAHVIVEEYAPAVLSHAVADRPYLFMLSAKSPSALKTMAARLHRHLQTHSELPLAGIARTLRDGRSHFEYRVAFPAGSLGDLLDRLNRFQSDDAQEATPIRRTVGHSARVIFFFDDGPVDTGNRWQDLHEKAPAFRESMRQCDEVFRSEFGISLTAMLYKSTAVVNPEANADGKTNAFPAASAFALRFAMAQLWRSCGVEPAAVSGSGIGEWVAACIAGVFSLEDALHLAVAAGRADSAEFERSLGRATIRQPQIPVLLDFSGSDPVDSAGYWIRRFRSGVPAALQSGAIAPEGFTATLSIGTALELRESATALVNRVQEKSAGLSAAAPDQRAVGRDDLREFFNVAAKLYGLGCTLDLNGLDGDAPVRIVPLPTYPFERERYWLEGEDRGRAESPRRQERLEAHRESPAESTADWIYELAWEPKALVQGSVDKDAMGFEVGFPERQASPQASEEVLHYAEMSRNLHPVCTGYIAQAFRQLGAQSFAPGAFTLDEFCQDLKVAPTRRRLLERLIFGLAEDGLVERSGGSFRLHPSAFESANESMPDARLAKVRAAYPQCQTELNVLQRCGENLAGVLLGSVDPVHLLFPNNSMEETEHIYRHSPIARFHNQVIADVVKAAADEARGRRLRVLEIGAGTGSTTASVLPVLATANAEYLFTDVSRAFLSRARVKFSEFDFVEYRTLDIETDPSRQGFERGVYDIVIAANVLHATSDLRRTIRHAKQLLAPGGLLLLLEAVRVERTVDLTFGLTDGWWRFTDFDLRSDGPIVLAETWMSLLRETGFSSSRAFSYFSASGDSSQQSVIVAQVDRTKEIAGELPDSGMTSREWIILADRGGVGDALARKLADQGHVVRLVRRPATAADLPVVWAEVRSVDRGPANVDILAPEIVYLWGLDAAESDQSSTPSLAGVELCGKTLVHIIQSALKQKTRGGFWIVTQGAQCIESDAPRIGSTVQSLAWGIGRTLRLEAPERFGALIDLDPTLAAEAAADDVCRELLASDLKESIAANARKRMTADGEDQIAYRGGRRLAARLRHTGLHREGGSSRAFQGLRRDGVYLLVGGLGGVGLRVARWMAEHNAGHLVLLGRTGIGASAGSFQEERLRAIREVRALGTAVTVVEGDVASADDMQALFRRFGAELPPLRGVIHAATAVDAAMLGELTDEAIDAMLRAKVAGTWQLHELTKNLELDFFLIFSSMTSLLGARGMAHYGAANQFADAFASFRHASGLPMLSVDWGIWDVMRLVSKGQQRAMQDTGMSPMSSERTLALLGDLIASNRAQVAIANIDWRLLKPLFERSRKGAFLEHVGGERSLAGTEIPIPIHAGLRATAEMSPEKRRKRIEALVQEQAGRVLGFQNGDLPPVDVPLTELGVDSLMAVDLKNGLQSELGLDLAPTIVFDYPRIVDLVELIDTMLWAAQDRAMQDPASVLEEEFHV